MKTSRALIVVASIASLVLAAAAAGCGGGGHSSPPSLLSVTPEQGSPFTRFTITGHGLSRNPKSSHVLFDGVPARVVAVGTGAIPSIVVQATSFQLSAAQSVDVTVNKSNPIAITLEPSGTLHPAHAPVFSIPVSLAQSGNVVYLVDPNGAWSVDLGTREIRSLARNGEDGWTTMTGIWKLSDGTLYVADVTPANAGRLFKQTSSGWLLVASGQGEVGGVARNAATADVYYTMGTRVGRIPGSPSSPSFSATLAEPSGDVVFQASKLLVTQPVAGKIVSVDPTNEAVADFKTGLSGTTALVGDGTNLFTNVSGSIDQIDGGGTVTTFFSGTMAGKPSRLAPFTGGTLLVSSDDASAVYQIASGATTPPVRIGGVETAISIARAPGEFLVADNETLTCGPTVDAAIGGILIGVRDDGTSHIVSEKACVIPQAQVVGNDLYYADVLSGIQKLDLASDTVTAVTTTASGFTGVAISMAVDDKGTVYAGYFDEGNTGAGQIGTIDPSGTVNTDLVDIPDGAPLALTVSGNRLWYAKILPNGSTTTEVDSVPVTGGTPVTVATVAPAFDSMIPDGDGGVYAADTLGLGELWHLHADGTGEDLGGVGTAQVPLAIEQDPLTGEIFASTFVGSINGPSSYVTIDP